MTLHKAHRLKEKWKAKNGHAICKHENLADPLVSSNGQDMGFMVCMECGEVYANHGEPLSSAEIKILKMFNAKDG